MLIMSRKYLLALGALFGSILLSSYLFYFYQVFNSPNILVNQPDRRITIATGTAFGQLVDQLYQSKAIHDVLSFRLLAKFMDYDENVKSGRYLFTSNMSNREAISRLRLRDQEPLNLLIPPVRRIENLSSKISAHMEFDAQHFDSLLLDEETPACYGFEPATFPCMFIPNTYQVFWTDPPEKILDRMKQEYDRFWTPQRKRKAQNLGLTQVQVSILASLVQCETNMLEEAPSVAGVYMNRLAKGIRLRADPTVIFALGDFTIRRLLFEHLDTESPYNTYIHRGLPPGPITIPTPEMLEATLNLEDHDYLFFCAKPDRSGYHVFSKTLEEHNFHASRFHRAMNKRKIFR